MRNKSEKKPICFKYFSQNKKRKKMGFNLSEEFYSRDSPVECWKLNIIAYIYVIMLALSVIFNSSLLMVFARSKELIQSLNVYIFVITVLNLFGSITQFSVVIPANLHCK